MTAGLLVNTKIDDVDLRVKYDAIEYGLTSLSVPDFTSSSAVSSKSTHPRFSRLRPPSTLHQPRSTTAQSTNTSLTSIVVVEWHHLNLCYQRSLHSSSSWPLHPIPSPKYTTQHTSKIAQEGCDKHLPQSLRRLHGCKYLEHSSC